MIEFFKNLYNKWTESDKDNYENVVYNEGLEVFIILEHRYHQFSIFADTYVHSTYFTFDEANKAYDFLNINKDEGKDYIIFQNTVIDKFNPTKMPNEAWR